MEILGLVLAISLIILYVLKVEECSRLRKNLEKYEARFFIVKLLKEFLEPKNIRNLQWSYNMRVGQVKLTWNKSVSNGVVGQPLMVVVNDVVVVDEVLGPDVESYEFKAAERAAVDVELRASNETFDSEPVTLNVLVPALSAPEAPTNLNYGVVGVEDAPDSPPVEPPVVESPVEPLVVELPVVEPPVDTPVDEPPPVA